MRKMRKRVRLHVAVGRKTLALATSLTAIAILATASTAGASLKQDLQRFSDCPYTDPTVVECVYSTTNSGEFVIGKSSVPITEPVIIQAGLKPFGVLVPATDGNTLSKTPLKVPGGLVGIELLGNFTEVTATAELAGQAEISTSVSLPLKVKLGNLALGNNCYLGSEAEPLALHLIYGTTNPPPPNKPISGSLTVTTKDKAITTLTGTLVDNAFAAPGANGCTLLPLVGDLAVNLKEGLPAAAGTNTAIMSGVTEETPSSLVKGVLPLPELGRCVKLEGKAEGKKLVFNGQYANASCTLAGEGFGKYEWLPGPGASPHFTGTSGPVKLETVGAKTSVACTGSSSAGEYTGAKTQTVSVTFTGCQTGPKSKISSCQSSGAAAGEIKTGSLTGGIDFIKENEAPEKPEVGVDLKPSSGSTLVTFECGGASTSISGSVIAPVTAVDKMSSTLKVTAKESGGKQSVEALEASPKDTLTFEPSGGGAEAGGLNATESRTSAEPLEIKAEI